MNQLMSLGKCIHNFTLDAKNIYNVVGIDSSYQWWFLSLGRDTNGTSPDGKSTTELKKRRKLVNEWLRGLLVFSSTYFSSKSATSSRFTVEQNPTS